MKAPLYSNRPIDFTVLNPGEFEEIVYHYFNEQIRGNLLNGIYDNVQLSVGVGERGVDIILYHKNRVVGCVQCKKYSNNVSEQIIFNDLVKFLMNHIAECIETGNKSSELIHSIDNFTYYIVVAKDITQKAKILIGDFQNNRKKLNLEETVNAIKAKYTKLNHLSFEDISNDLEEILDTIKIEHLNASDIDKVIRSNTDIIQKYFAVKEVVDHNTTELLKDRLGIDYSHEKITQLAKNASSSISGVKAHFGNNQNSVIQRSEVNDILEWIKTPLKPNTDNIAVVSGNAGLGKSVVMSQLYLKLLLDEIPTICLKADRLAFENIDDLGRECGLGTDFFRFMDQFISIESAVVLIIDQIDALSQTLSSNLKPLGMYDRIIKRYINYPKVKIVVSCRTYDLNYDPIINSYSNKKSFIIQPLELENVKQVLVDNKINPDKLTPALIELLRVPLHLDVFLKVYSTKMEISAIKSIQDLYTELWKLRINANNTEKSNSLDFKKVAELVFKIAVQMYEYQTINVPDILFADNYPEELKYLSTEGIILEKDNRLEFFHQTFFDYSIARNFVSSGESLITNIKDRHQGLFLRSKIQQILNYRRGNDPQKYLSDLQEILPDPDIRFHIKLLIFQQIALHDSPISQEILFIKKIFENNEKFKDIFISLYHGNGWLDTFIDNEWIENEVNNSTEKELELIRSFLRRFTHRQSDKLLNYLWNLKSKLSIDSLIHDLLWSVREFDDPRYLTLVEHLLEREGEAKLGYTLYHFLEHGLKNYPDKVSELILSLVSIAEKEVIGEDNYFPGQNHSEIYNELWNNHPYIAYALVKQIINQIIEKRSRKSSSETRGDIKVDIAFLLYTRKDDHLYFHEEQLSKLQDFLIGEASINPDFVKNEVLEYLESDYVTHLSIAFSIIKEHPSLFLQESFNFFSTDIRVSKMIGLSSYLNYLLQISLGISYSNYTVEQQKIINSILMELYPAHELKVLDFGDGKKIRNKSYGNTKYDFLIAIPEDKRNNYPDLKKSFEELERKFGPREKLEEPKGIQVRSGGNSLHPSAYDNMSSEDWKNSFRAYTNKNPNYDHWNDPDEYTHARVFSDKIAENTSKYLPLIDDILLDQSIPKLYKVKALDGLKNGLLEPKELLIRFKNAINNNPFDDENIRELIWITEYFTKSNIVDSDVYKFIKHIALNGAEIGVITDDVLNSGINSNRGAAVSSLMDYHFSEEKRSDILETVKSIANFSPSTRACALYKLQNFLQYNENEVLEVSLLLIHDYNPGLVKLSVHVFTYLINSKFEELKPFLKKSIYIPEASKSIGHLLTKAYCFEYPGAQELIEEFWLQGDDQKEASINIAWEFIKAKSCVEKAIEIVSRFIDSESEKVVKAYIFPFFNIKPELFGQLYEFLSAYVKSPAGKFREESFYRFLLKCTNEEPEKCIYLSSQFVNHMNILKNRQMHRYEPLQVIIQAYNALREYNKDDDATEDAMDAFDSILQNQDLRAGAFEVLAKVDLY